MNSTRTTALTVRTTTQALTPSSTLPIWLLTTTSESDVVTSATTIEALTQSPISSANSTTVEPSTSLLNYTFMLSQTQQTISTVAPSMATAEFTTSIQDVSTTLSPSSTGLSTTEMVSRMTTATQVITPTVSALSSVTVELSQVTTLIVQSTVWSSTMVQPKSTGAATSMPPTSYTVQSNLSAESFVAGPGLVTTVSSLSAKAVPTRTDAEDLDEFVVDTSVHTETAPYTIESSMTEPESSSIAPSMEISGYVAATASQARSQKLPLALSSYPRRHLPIVIAYCISFAWLILIIIISRVVSHHVRRRRRRGPLSV